ncbi:hypothetical protein K4A83_17260 [Spirulina subsalsa FACHB-351]|uniref:O-antigen polymerase n=1 Tax=Spirulina subsalsa FACHB-351 TaxID=234711 RepID=A0ABT3L922_9CYAN|nr:hypothetical protein [Spirulina subsalsa]MCW6038006.1 hypothetical protein [Spirulina subsalsa FACHB-351]
MNNYFFGIITFVFLLGLCSWQKTARWFITLIPLYYAPFLFVEDIYSEDWIFLRAGKDVLSFTILVSWIIYLAKRRSLKKWNSLLPSLLIAFFILLGIFKIIYLDESVQVEILRLFLLSPIWYFLSVYIYPKNFYVKQQIYRWVLVSFLVSLIGIGEWLFLSQENIFSKAAGQTRVVSTLFNPNALGWYLFAMNALLIGASNQKWKSTKRFEFSPPYTLLVLSINCFTMVLSGSRSALIPNFLMLGCWILLKFKNGVVAFFGLSFGLIAITIISISTLNFQIYQIRAFSSFQTLRWDIYKKFLVLVSQANPIEFLTGFNENSYNLANKLGLINDSYVLAVGSIAGIISVIILFLAIVLSLILKNKQYQQQPSLLYLVLGLSLIGVIGNVQGIFPHGIIFWVCLGLMNSKNSQNI